MNDKKKSPENPSQQKPQAKTPEELERDQQPLRVRHGRKILDEVNRAHRDVVETVSNTSLILELLTPSQEENPVLAALETIILTQRHQLTMIESIERKLSSIQEQLNKHGLKP